MKRPGLEERLKNTVELLKNFADENLEPDQAEEIKRILGVEEDGAKNDDNHE